MAPLFLNPGYVNVYETIYIMTNSHGNIFTLKMTYGSALLWGFMSSNYPKLTHEKTGENVSFRWGTDDDAALC